VHVDSPVNQQRQKGAASGLESARQPSTGGRGSAGRSPVVGRQKVGRWAETKPFIPGTDSSALPSPPGSNGGVEHTFGSCPRRASPRGPWQVQRAVTSSSLGFDYRCVCAYLLPRYLASDPAPSSPSGRVLLPETRSYRVSCCSFDGEPTPWRRGAGDGGFRDVRASLFLQNYLLLVVQTGSPRPGPSSPSRRRTQMAPI